MGSARQDFRGMLSIFQQSWGGGLAADDPEESDYEDSEDEADETGDNDTNDSTNKDFNPKVTSINYKYAPLSDANSYIRLLELQAGQGQDHIACRLEEVSLSASNMKYDALSYVWGLGPPDGKTKTIQVDDNDSEISINLHYALRHLRHAERSRFLWVDAICIDQSSIAERNVQLPLMCEIYQNAASTVCFLGPAAKSTGGMCKMLTELAQDQKSLEAKNQSDATEVMQPAFLNQLLVAPIKTETSQKYMGDQTIVPLAICEWWHRAWTIQELMLSSNAVLMMSRHTVSWEVFCAAADYGLSTQIWGHVAFGFLVNPVTVPYLSMRALMGRYRHPDQMGSPAADLLHLLIHCRHRESTDPRDKVYAVLGLLRATHPDAISQETSDALHVALGYNHDVAYVYCQVSQEIIQKTGNMDILGVCPKSDRPFIPTWVTDWSMRDRIGSPLMQDSLDRARTTHATKQTKANARFSNDGASMIITGYELTSVATLAGPLFIPVLNVYGADYRKPYGDDFEIPEFELPEGTGRLRLYWLILKHIWSGFQIVFNQTSKTIFRDCKAVMSVFVTLFEWERFAVSQPPTNPGGESGSIYWQTLCAGTYINGSIEETEVMFEAWCEILQPLHKFMNNHPKFCVNHPFFLFLKYVRVTWNNYGEFWPYITCSHYRRLGWAANGWLCLLPQDTEEKDVVVLARGGRIPLVVRLHEDGYYTFVGEAYIHGIMNGEVFDESKCVDIEIR